MLHVAPLLQCVNLTRTLSADVFVNQGYNNVRPWGLVHHPTLLPPPPRPEAVISRDTVVWGAALNSARAMKNLQYKNKEDVRMWGKQTGRMQSQCRVSACVWRKTLAHWNIIQNYLSYTTSTFHHLVILSSICVWCVGLLWTLKEVRFCSIIRKKRFWKWQLLCLVAAALSLKGPQLLYRDIQCKRRLNTQRWFMGSKGLSLYINDSE